MTTISVIIPAYNAQRTILETIQSVQQQTIKDLEIIVIDDGSTDQTLNVVKSIKDSRIQIFAYPNSGVSTARNRGILKANSEYISFIDADDLWTPDKLEKQLAALKSNPQANVAYSWIAIMLDKNIGQTSLFSGKKVTFKGNIYAQLLLDNFVGNGSNILARREAIISVEGFDPSLQTCEDWDLYLRLATKYHYVLVPEQQIVYRKASGTLSANASIIETGGLKVIDKAYRTAPKKLQHQKNKSLAKLFIVCGRIYFDNSRDSQDIIKAREKIWKALKLNPLILFSYDSFSLLVKIMLQELLMDRATNSLLSILKKPREIDKLK
jgi:glycosyltransferase involved in cell wall biosynthesis